MKAARVLGGAMLLAALAFSLPLRAQTNADAAANGNGPDQAPAATRGPVVMPPDASSSNIPESATPVPDASATAPAIPGATVTTPGASGAAQAAPQLPGASGTAKEDEIKDIRPPLFFLRSWLWLWVLLGALAAMALLVLTWKWFRTRGGFNPKTAYDLALEKLELARELMREDNPAPYAVAVSEAIRAYLGRRFQSPSSRRTTEEFLRQMQNDPGTPLAEHQDLLGAFLRSCDLVKFARYQPTQAELEEVHRRAVSFVEATKPAANDAAPARLQPVGARP